MGLVDNYREELKAQGINIDLKGIRAKKDRTRLYLTVIGIIVAIPTYFAIYSNYTYCSVVSAWLSSSSAGQSSSAVSGSFLLKCGINSALYSVSAGILIFIILLLCLKAFEQRRYSAAGKAFK